MRCNDAYNGCTNCGPSLTIYAKGGGSSLVQFGYTPYLPLPDPTPVDIPIRYLNFTEIYTRRSKRIITYISCGGCTEGPGGCSCNYCKENYPEFNCAGDEAYTHNLQDDEDAKTIRNFQYKINSNVLCGGQILSTDTDDSYNFKGIFSQSARNEYEPLCSYPGQLFCWDGVPYGYLSLGPLNSNSNVSHTRSAFSNLGPYNTSSSFSPCRPQQVCSTNNSTMSNLGPVGDIGSGPGGYPVISNTLRRFFNDKDVFPFTSSSSSPYSFGSTYTSVTITQTLSSPKTRAYFQPITEQILDISLNRKNSNGNFCSLYSEFGGLSVADKNELTYTAVQVAKFGIGIDKKILIDKKISSIRGTLYLFYGGEEGETPCCQDCGGPECFTGTIVSQSDFSITNSPQDKEFPIDIVGQKGLFEFRNLKSDITPGTSLSCCYTIKSIT